MDRCAECGFTYDEAASGDTAAILRALAAQHVEVLMRPGAEQLAVLRPAPGVWSVLEYSCHVRDVLLVQRDRVILALVEDSPSFARMYRDERVALAGYNQERLEDVAGELVMAADLAGKVFEKLSSEQGDRLCIYNFPAPTERNVRWLSLHTVHEAKHHLGDVQLVLARLTA